MEPEFWHERWRTNDIGFHQPHVHTLLQRHWQRLPAPANGRVLVPLAGKSRDIHWLRSAGHTVVGVELSSLAIEQFFGEAGLRPTRGRRGLFETWDADGITMMAGDFFNLTAADVSNVDAVYDRAALIALPPDMRMRYARHMGEIVPIGATMLLIAIDYPDGEIAGPPFSVTSDDVHALFSQAFAVERLETRDGLAASENLRKRNVTRMDEAAYLLRRTR